MHVSLDSALGRQRRLNSVGESVLQIAPNAAAAYSLRSLTGGDPKVVRVRRGSNNVESDFTASGVSSGALLDFVTTSQIGWNVQPTFSNDSGTGSVTSQSSTATTATVAFTGDADLIRQTSKPNHVLGSSGDQVIFNISVSGLDSTGTLRLRTSGTNTTVGSSNVSNGDNQDITLNLTGSAGYLAITAVASSGGTITFNSIKVLPKSGFVETWYDQSGNGKDAVQETAANQPLLVASGVVLSGLDFDGSTSSKTLVAPSVTGLAGSLSIFSVSVRDATGNTVSLSNSSSGGRYFAIQEGGSTSVANPRNITSITVSDSVSGANRLTFAVTTGATSTSVGANSSAVTTTTDDYGDDFSGTHINQIAIGVLRTASPTGYFNGRINEILVYNSDQTDNRSAVETNINSHYSLF